MQATLRNDLIKIAYDNREYRALLLPLFSGKTAGEATITERAIRLAYANPELRKIVLPVIKKIALDPSYGQGKKPSDKAMAHREKQQERRDESNAMQAAIGMKQKLLDHFGEDFRVKWKVEGSRGEDISISTLIGYATDKDNPNKKEAQKILEDLKKQSYSDKAKKFIGKIGKGLLKETSRALAVTAKSILGGIGSVSEGLGDAILSKTDGPGAILSKSCAVASDAIKGDKGSDLINNIEKAYSNIMSGQADHKGLAKGTFAMKQVGLAGAKSMGGAMKKGAKYANNFLGESITRTGASLIGGAVGGAFKGIGKVANGLAPTSTGDGLADKAERGVSKGLSKAKKFLSRKASEEEVDQLLASISDYMGEIDEDTLQAMLPYMDDNGKVNVEKLEKDIKEQGEALKKDIEEQIAKLEKEDSEKAKKEEEAKKKKEEAKKKKEEGKKDEKAKKELKDKFVAKKAVVKMAYENPKYRPQILQLLQVPRTHYAIADIREIISNG